MTTKKFCLMTEGRSGSTSFMEALEAFDDIAVPNKNIKCVDNELVHPKNVQNYMEEYAGLCGRPIETDNELIDAFFEYNRDFPFAGFKSMPNRHPDFEDFAARGDIRFITLKRRDVASTVASFTLAGVTGSWRRHGEERNDQWRFDPEQDEAWIRSNLSYILDSHVQLGKVPGAIELHYEDLCDTAFSCLELNEFFKHDIRLRDPRPPTSGSSYVSNWEEFRTFVENTWNELAGSGAGAIPFPRAGQPAVTGKQETAGTATTAAPDQSVNQEDFTALEKFCLFIGYPSSCGTLIGALLDAHPDVVIANDVDVLKYLDEDIQRDQMLAMLISRAREFAAGGCNREGHGYLVPNQWQGRYRSLKVIGDRKNGMASIRLNGELAQAEKLRQLVGAPVRIVHVYRNPFDNIAALSRSRASSLQDAVNIYFNMANSAGKVSKLAGPGEIYELCIEDFMEAPAGQLRALCEFLGVEATDDYLADCAGIIHATPGAPASNIDWTAEQVEVITRLMSGFPHLQRYLERKQVPAVRRPAARPAATTRQSRPPARKSGTGQIIYVWELGMDLGHIMRFLPLALKLRDRGHGVVFAIRDLQHAETAIGQQGFPVFQAPVWMAMPKGLKNPPLNYAEIILRYGFFTAPGLKGLVKAWRAMYQAVGAELVVADHSPSALLAAHTMDLKCVTIGHGFFSPPPVTPTPNMRPWMKVSEERLKSADALALANANSVIVDLGGRPLKMLSELFRVDTEFLCTFPELDHYPNRSGAQYWGPGFNVDEGKAIDWPQGDQPAVFAYLKTAYRDYEKVLAALAAMDIRVIAYTPGITAKIAEKFQSPKMIISKEPVRLAGIRDNCALAVCHAGIGTVAAFLLAGTPLLLLPTQLEQFLISRQVEALGAGLLVDAPPERPAQGKPAAGKKTKKPKQVAVNYRKLLSRLLEEPSFRDAAAAFANKYSRFHPTAQSSAMATAVEKILTGEA